MSRVNEFAEQQCWGRQADIATLRLHWRRSERSEALFCLTGLRYQQSTSSPHSSSDARNLDRMSMAERNLPHVVVQTRQESCMNYKPKRQGGGAGQSFVHSRTAVSMEHGLGILSIPIVQRVVNRRRDASAGMQNHGSYVVFESFPGVRVGVTASGAATRQLATIVEGSPPVTGNWQSA